MQINKLFFFSALLGCYWVLLACNRSDTTKIDIDLPKYPPNAGVGLIHFNTQHAIPLFKNPTEKDAYNSIQFKVEEKGEDKGITHIYIPNQKNLLQPYDLNVGDSEKEGKENQQMGLFRFAPKLSFRVMEKLSDGVIVLLNEKTRETSFIKLDPKNDYRNGKEHPEFFDPNFVDTKISNWYYYESWEQALKRAYMVTVPSGTLIYDKPNGTGSHLSNIQNLYFKVTEVDGDWAQVSTRGNVLAGDKEVLGWVIWKANEEIKVNILLNGGYD
ncbi:MULTISPECIES: hypothetical protein [Sphingobacterium]|uniref:Uncharacterized protein n=1 Tax=Sphingobacterium tenebrionis TaxID=3111775 RepID=A0ABU8I287_9SPHI|nr:hypothetical protein [Sphingobacterium sp. CZ-2]QBR11689.1 hypothetical protein E3D81_05675 [Sphingobacterium sp. CZ-2]